jgi:hypothetical protein
MCDHSALDRAHYRRCASAADDFVKVRVWLGSNYHVLSRFLITRLLTVTKVRAFEIDRRRPAQCAVQIPNSDAVRIALKLKKVLVDQSQFDISQADLEQILFKVGVALSATRMDTALLGR